MMDQLIRELTRERIITLLERDSYKDIKELLETLSKYLGGKVTLENGDPNLNQGEVAKEENRPVLQNPAEKNHTIFVTVGIRVNYGDAENADNPYSSERISEMLDDALKCEVCGNWHWNQDLCGMDEAWLEDVAETEV